MGKRTFGLLGEVNKKFSTTKIIRKDIKYEDILYHYDNNHLVIPEYQRSLDTEKIDEIVEEVNNNNNYLNIYTNSIQLASIQRSENDWVHYILDGQHRLKAILELANTFPNNFQGMVLHICDNEKEAISIFQKLIKGQESSYLISEECFSVDFRSSIKFRLREYLKKYYPEHFVETQKNNYIYSIDIFLLELENRGFFDKKVKKENEIVKKLFKKMEKFSKKVNYETYYKNNPKLFYKKELDMLEDCDCKCMGLKRNNFVDYLFSSKESKIIPNHNFRTEKSKISKKLKDEVWKTYYDNKEKTKCPIIECSNIISKNSFHTGHIISEKNGGTLDIDNLHPICSECNMKMGCKNWYDYDKKSYNNIKEEEFFEVNDF